MTDALQKSDERVFAIVDGDNLYEFFLKLDESPLAVINAFAAGRTCQVKPVFFFSYDESLHNRDQQRYSLATRLWADKIRGLNFQFRYYNRRRKGYPDMELFVHAMLNIEQYDTLMLFALDGDYICMIKYLQASHGKKVELYHADYDLHHELPPAADKAIDMLDTFTPTEPLNAHRNRPRWRSTSRAVLRGRSLLFPMIFI